MRPRINGARVWLAVAGLAIGCSPFREVMDAGKLDAVKKVVVGDVRIVNGDLDKWVPGLFVGAYLVFDYQLPMHGGQVYFTPDDGFNAMTASSASDSDEEPRKPTFDRYGGPFRVGVENRDTYLLGIRVSSTYVVSDNRSSFPFFIWIRPSSNRCEYIGTLLVTRVGEKIFVELRDEYEAFASRHPSWVKGCTTVKNLATAMTESQLRRFGYRLPP